MDRCEVTCHDGDDGLERRRVDVDEVDRFGCRGNDGLVRELMLIGEPPKARPYCSSSDAPESAIAPMSA